MVRATITGKRVGEGKIIFPVHLHFHMHTVLRDYIRTKNFMSEEKIPAVLEKFVPVKVKKKQPLLREGDICNHLWFIAQGCVRMYKIDSKGNDHIIQFAFENYWVGDRESAITHAPSKYSIDAIEDSTVLQIKKEDLQEIYNSIPEFREMHLDLQQRNFYKVQDRIRISLSYSAEEKYEDLLEHQPQILTRVPLSMVASYLGISRETLSRIRANQAKRH